MGCCCSRQPTMADDEGPPDLSPAPSVVVSLPQKEPSFSPTFPSLPSSSVTPTTSLPVSQSSSLTSLHRAFLFSSSPSSPVITATSSPVLFPAPVLLSSSLSTLTVSPCPSLPSSPSPTGIQDLPDCLTTTSTDVSSPPGSSSDVSEQSSSATSNDRVPAAAGSELHEVETTGPPAQTAEFSEPGFSSLQREKQREERAPSGPVPVWCSQQQRGERAPSGPVPVWCSQQQREERASSGRSKTRPRRKALGLPNIGNSCFLNSALQCLYSVPCFCTDITGQEDLWSPRRKTTLKLLRYLGELYKSRQGKGSYRGKRRLLWSIKSSLAELNEEYEHYSEQDAHEFLLLLFMKMKMEGETLQRTSTSLSYICPVQNFEFRLQCVRTCSSCGDQVFQEEEQNNLSLDLHPSLIASLQLYFKPSELECTCRQCCGCQATLVRYFLTLPRVLLLHMKRFHHDGAWLRKVTDAVSIPPRLCLASLVGEQGGAAGMDTLRASYEEGDFASQAKPKSNQAPVDHLVSSGDRERDLQEVSVPVKDHRNQTTYRLSGIVSHLGESIDTGHYISDIAGENGTGWVTLNDSHVMSPAETTVLRTREETAYILFYILCGADEGDHVPPGQNQELSGADDGETQGTRGLSPG